MRFLPRHQFEGSPLKIAASLAFALLLCGGCSSKDAKAKAPGNSNGGSAAARPAWNWDHYPLAPRMRLGTLPCQLQPKSMIPVHSPLLGTLRVYVTTPQTNLPQGFLWAEFEPEIFASEEKSFTEALRKLEEREKVQWEIDLPRQLFQLEQQRVEQQRQVDLVRLFWTNKTLADDAFRLGLHGSLLRPDALTNAETQLHLLTRTLEFLQETNLTALGMDLVGQRSEFERRKLEFDKRRANSQFRMPFDGKLTLNLPITEGVKEYPVTASQEIGVVRDLSSIRLRVPMANASWTALPSEKLNAIIRLPSGEGLEAAFAYQKIERIQNREESVYYFGFPENRAATVARLIGSDVGCELWVKLDEPVRIVPKLSLVLNDPNAFQNRSWASGVTSRFPGARVLVEGQSDIGIVPPKGVTVSQVSMK